LKWAVAQKGEPMRKNFLRYWAGVGALLILTPSAAQTPIDKEMADLKRGIEARNRLIERAEKESRLCSWGQLKDSDPPRPKISENLGEPPNDWSSVRIRLTRSMCLGTCPDYTVEISGTGDVTYDGGAYVRVSGVQRSKISPESVRDLYESFVRAGFFSMPEIYCMRITDLSTTTTSIEYDGRIKEVINHHTGPAELRYLEAKIDDVAGTIKWVPVPVPPDPQWQPLLRQRCEEKSIDEQFCKNL
jgi:hypothetical protein